MALSPEFMKMVSAAKNKYSGQSGKTVKPKEGRNVYRFIMQTLDGNPQFWRELGVHWIKADENGKPLVVIGDPQICYSQPSVIANAIDAAIASATDEDSKKLYESWKARASILVFAVSRNDNDEVQLLELTPTTFGKVMNTVEVYAAAGVDILDPVSGYDIVIERRGKGLATEYDVQIAPLAPGKSFKPVSKDQLEKIYSIDDYIAKNFFRGDEQKALNAIAQIAQVSVPRLSGPVNLSLPGTSTPAPALTSPGVAVPGANAAAPVVDDIEARRQKIMEEAKRRMEADLAALESPAAPAAAGAAAAAGAVTVGGLSASDQESILNELAGLEDLG